MFRMPFFSTIVLSKLSVLWLATQVIACKDSGYGGHRSQSYYPPAAVCNEYTIPVTVTSKNLVFNGTKWDNNYALEDFISLATTRPSAGFPGVLQGPVTETATYEIAASFCTPKKPNGKEKTVIFATHGIGPGRAHWNSPFKPDDYNFVQFAIAQGYSVFFYDRLGCGDSQKVSGFSNQISKAVAVIQELSGMVKSGKYTGDIGKPQKLAVMGFSFGSFATHFAIAEKPEIADAVILTGIGFNTTGLNLNGLVRSFVPRIANVQNPNLYGDRDNGYLTWADELVQVQTYFKYGFYEEQALKFTELAKQPFAIGEFLTILAGDFDASKYTGPALTVTGENDYIVCDGYCPGIYEEPARTYYRNAKLTTHIHPSCSHNINFHHNATGAYRVITDFLQTHGL